MAIKHIKNNENTGFIKELTWNHLHQANRTTLKPFQITLKNNDEILSCNEIIRVMPGKRVVAFGTLGDKEVVAKLFYKKGHAERHAKREFKGVDALQKNGVITPKLYYHGSSINKKIHVLVFEKINKVKSIEDIWQGRKSIKSILPILRLLVIELATHHVLGILQHDLHLKNFLLQKKKIYTIDGGDIEVFDKPLSTKLSLTNLGLFLSQFGVGSDELQKMLYKTYAESRGWQIKPREVQALHAAIRKWSKKRWEQNSEKVMRTCSSFVRRQSLRQLTVYDRNEESAELFSYLKNPEAIFSSPETEILKAGGKSTVVKFKMNGREFVAKRYNVKGVLHWLRRCLRSTRAAKSWYFGQQFRLFGIRTPKPIAFIEKRFFGLRGTSYLLMEYVPAEHAGEYFSSAQHDAASHLAVAQKITDLIKNLADIRITHGDLKMTNILIANQNPVLIDLDGVESHYTSHSLHQAFQKEVKRFMENWQSNPSSAKLFGNLFK